jgi:peptidoglycan/LPS O-acetylase OafA/YrhL
MPQLDAMKGIACLLIVSHHLAFYGPMSDVVMSIAPGLVIWLYDNGRIAVQVFLVVAGFLTAGQLSKLSRSAQTVAVFALVWQRYLRLAIPYVIALGVAMVVAASLRPWFFHESVPTAPEFWRVLGHILMLHGWLGQESLSAGVWYVAIDLQLYALAVLLFWCGQRLAGPRLPGDTSAQARLVAWVNSLTAALMLASLLFFNRLSEFDITGLYFFGSYAMGMLARWAGGRSRPWLWLTVLALVGLLALMLEFRARILVALLTSMVLGVTLLRGHWSWVNQPWLAWLGRISYSVFLIHFPVCLVFNAAWQHWFPTGPWVNALGMVSALAASVACGHLFWTWIEQRGSAHVMGRIGQLRSQGRSG